MKCRGRYLTKDKENLGERNNLGHQSVEGRNIKMCYKEMDCDVLVIKHLVQDADG